MQFPRFSNGPALSSLSDCRTKPSFDLPLSPSSLTSLSGGSAQSSAISSAASAMAVSAIPAASAIFRSWNVHGRPFNSCGVASLPYPRLHSRTTFNPLMARRKFDAGVRFVVREGADTEAPVEAEEDQGMEEVMVISIDVSKGDGKDMGITAPTRAARRLARKKAEQRRYLVAAIMSSFGFTSMAAAAVYYRFAWQIEGSAVPLTEMIGTFSLTVGATVGMEYWARWAHRALWHASLWPMHESHHRPRDGPFELNDVFAIINAFPAIGLLAFGLFNRGLFPGLCFGAGLGITLYGMAYMFVHDGLVHRRFSVGPISNVPYFQKVAAAHQIHHADKFNGVPYGLFLGHQELEEVGGTEELDREIKRRINCYNSSSNLS